MKVPPYAHHLIGVGGFVVNDKDEILVIEERFSITGRSHWKLPGGQNTFRTDNFNLIFSVTRLGNLLHFGQPFKACSNNYFAHI